MHLKQHSRIVWRALSVTIVLLCCGCHQKVATTSGPLPQRGYLWQRAWTPAVGEALKQADQNLDGVIVLGAEISWENGKPQPIEANISWPDLRAARKPVSIALRIAPYPGPFAPDDATAGVIVAEAHSLLEEARSNGVELREMEIDFDCAQNKLKGYELWLHALATAVHPTRLAITTLPAWLKEPEFAALVRHVDGYVLQVHSVPTLAESGRVSLCDPALARKWVEQASRIGAPFSVAFPTYRCLAGYDSTGKLIGIAMDSVQPSWPAGTRTLEFSPNADDIADLVNEWRTNRPEAMREIIWYRLPVATDQRNWRWPTLLSVMAGRHPEHRLEISHQGETPMDFTIGNAGSAEEQLDCDVVVRWNGTRPVACDALPGWSVSSTEGQAVFSAIDHRLRLSPGKSASIGWIRLAHDASLQTQLVTHEQKSP